MADFLPALGFGTYTLTDREECVNAVMTALETRYRHVDTAQVYDNERFVGEAIDASPVPREEVTVATKLHWERLGYDDLLESAAESRDRLGVDVIDLLYVHWPVETYDPSETFPALDELVDRGVVDRIGFCNCSPEQLDEARAGLDAPVAAHQVECHPLLPQNHLVEYAREHDHEFVAAVPLGKGEVLDLLPVRAVSERRGVSRAQVALAWQICRSAIPIPKARGDHIADNYGALDAAATLGEEDLARVDGVGERRRIVSGWPGAHWKQDE